MRKKIHQQLPLMPPPVAHDHADEVSAMGQILDAVPLELLELVQGEIQGGAADKGRPGMTADLVVRCLAIKQMKGFSYDALAFHLADSTTYRRFCRLGFADEAPKKSALQKNIKKVTAETWEQINRWVIGYAKDEGIENGRKARVDSTVTSSNIHEPTDSSLLFDVVRVLCRIMAVLSFSGAFTNHTRRAKRRHIGIVHAKNAKERKKRYRDLLKVTRRTLRAAGQAALELENEGSLDWAATLSHYVELGGRVIYQTERRVLEGKRVPPAKKVFSIFEPHTDIIIKDRREVYFGHKLNLTTGASGLVLDVVVEKGNPADSTRAVTMIERQCEIFGRPPRQAAFDGGYASAEGLRQIKDLGVKDVAFSKKRGLEVPDMVKSNWVYRQLKKFRAGIEAGISFLKRCFGLDRCTWRGFQSFKAYVWGSVLSHNLLTIARHRLASQTAA